MEFYTAMFKQSKIVGVSRHGEAGPGPKGTVMVGAFDCEMQQGSIIFGKSSAPAERRRRAAG
jgi:predicted 3-demethylubiquinone-9 3-methyltransferase (glyoxalase superfamily)